MIRGKTARAAGGQCGRDGRGAGGAQTQQLSAASLRCESLGLAFQIQDDILGIWGD
ncbi:MAG: polyprenyl synthetase family protein, partial [Anaerolineae bacterium]|nr:polyprenyl synthetase family protein [Anaerolineae bacterium]